MVNIFTINSLYFLNLESLYETELFCSFPYKILSVAVGVPCKGFFYCPYTASANLSELRYFAVFQSYAFFFLAITIVLYVFILYICTNNLLYALLMHSLCLVFFKRTMQKYILRIMQPNKKQ